MNVLSEATLKATVRSIAGLKGQKVTSEQADQFVARVRGNLGNYVLSQARAFTTTPSASTAAKN